MTKPLSDTDPRHPSFVNPFDGERNVTIRRMTLVEAMAACAYYYADTVEYDYNVDGWCDALRHVGVIKE